MNSSFSVNTVINGFTDEITHNVIPQAITATKRKFSETSNKHIKKTKKSKTKDNSKNLSSKVLGLLNQLVVLDLHKLDVLFIEFLLINHDIPISFRFMFNNDFSKSIEYKRNCLGNIVIHIVKIYVSHLDSFRDITISILNNNMIETSDINSIEDSFDLNDLYEKSQPLPEVEYLDVFEKASEESIWN